jgi:hypothetical protein
MKTQQNNNDNNDNDCKVGDWRDYYYGITPTNKGRAHLDAGAHKIKISVFVNPLTAKSLQDHLAPGRLIEVAVALYLKLELEGVTK